jgi:peptidoglycan/xylan/chitin deacetylase (PgdA/CDA1 family)
VSIRALGKILAYKSGVLGAYHRRRHADTLTVLMFHRVLPAAEMARLGADPLYTVTPEFLADCIVFLRKHYAIVSLDDVVLSRKRVMALPSPALLITFDDGWHDNMEFALPVLRGTPWTIFAALDAISEPQCWWQEVLLWAIRTNRCTAKEILSAAGKALPEDCDIVHALLTHMEALSAGERDSVLARYRAMLCGEIYNRRMMLSAEDLHTLTKAGVSIGAHGDSHLPVTMLADSKMDLSRSRDRLTRYLGTTPTAMSFPHGLHDHDSVDQARELGFPLLFTSEPHINGCKNGWVESDLLGRIPIDMHDVSDGAGALSRHKLATWLFLRDVLPKQEPP